MDGGGDCGSWSLLLPGSNTGVRTAPSERSGAPRRSDLIRGRVRSERREYGIVSTGPDWIQASVRWRKGT